MTTQEIIDLPLNKIRTINTQVGAFAQSMKFKVMKDSGKIVVITRDGLLKYMGNAQLAFYSGKKNKDFKVFNTALNAFNFISK